MELTNQQQYKIEVQHLNCFYGQQQVLFDLSLHLEKNEILSIIGPANSGKTSLMRCLNRASDYIAQMKTTGDIFFDGKNIRQEKDGTLLRRKIGMVAPLPVGLPMSVRDNVTFAPRMAGIKNKNDLEEIMVDSLQKASLWDEIKDRLDMDATRLSGGQQQRLTIARALSHLPEVLCLDEFSIAIDPVTTARIEEVLLKLKSEMSIILVTNIIFQAKRLADRVIMMYGGKILDLQEKELFFSKEQLTNHRTRDYIDGKWG